MLFNNFKLAGTMHREHYFVEPIGIDLIKLFTNVKLVARMTVILFLLLELPKTLCIFAAKFVPIFVRV